MEEMLRLQAKLTAKKTEIQALMAQKHGMGRLSELSPVTYRRLEVLTDECLED
jgi:hypothetical protein